MLLAVACVLQLGMQWVDLHEFQPRVGVSHGAGGAAATAAAAAPVRRAVSRMTESQRGLVGIVVVAAAARGLAARLALHTAGGR
eukprot:COSAG01_NODE_1112_length_11654_cov_8.254435_7_plen_84_part_00